MLRGALFAVALAAGLVTAALVMGVDLERLMDLKALSALAAYAGVAALARHRPGVCLYRMVVLARPERHTRRERAMAYSFASFARERLLIAGLIFALADVALAVHQAEPAACEASMAGALPAALYALFFYVVAVRVAGTLRQRPSGGSAIPLCRRS